MGAVLNHRDLLQVLTRHGVDFVVVGGVAAILEGAPISTFDLDIVWDPTPENRERLFSALQDLQARYNDPGGRQIFPSLEKLTNLRLHQLITARGPLDVMSEIGHGMTYHDLIGHTEEYDAGDLRVRVLKLEVIILSKEQAMREKDRAALPVLRRTLALKRAGEVPGE